MFKLENNWGNLGGCTMFKTEKLDHGVISIPNRTKNINSDLDRYKQEKEKQDKRIMEDRKFINSISQDSAKELFSTLEKNHFQYYASRAGVKLSEAKTELKAMCINPKKAIKAFNAIIEMEARQ